MEMNTLKIKLSLAKVTGYDELGIDVKFSVNGKKYEIYLQGNAARSIIEGIEHDHTTCRQMTKYIREAWENPEDDFNASLIEEMIEEAQDAITSKQEK